MFPCVGPGITAMTSIARSEQGLVITSHRIVKIGREKDCWLTIRREKVSLVSLIFSLVIEKTVRAKE